MFLGWFGIGYRIEVVSAVRAEEFGRVLMGKCDFAIYDEASVLVFKPEIFGVAHSSHHAPGPDSCFIKDFSICPPIKPAKIFAAAS